MLNNGHIKFDAKGRDAWQPGTILVYGFDQAEGRPDEVVPLVSIPNFLGRSLSTNTSEGDPSYDLEVLTL